MTDQAPQAALAESLVDVIEQAIFETDTGLAAALLASDRAPSALAAAGFAIVPVPVLQAAITCGPTCVVNGHQEIRAILATIAAPAAEHPRGES
jgi:hypothetical protein